MVHSCHSLKCAQQYSAPLFASRRMSQSSTLIKGDIAIKVVQSSDASASNCLIKGRSFTHRHQIMGADSMLQQVIGPFVLRL